MTSVFGNSLLYGVSTTGAGVVGDSAEGGAGGAISETGADSTVGAGVGDGSAGETTGTDGKESSE